MNLEITLLACFCKLLNLFCSIPDFVSLILFAICLPTEDVLVLTDESNRILGVFGFGVDENYKVSAQTQAVIVVSLRY